MALPDSKRVMLSYNWKSQAIVSKVYHILKDANLQVWFDVAGGMKDDIYKSMAEGVENAAIVCCFMSPEYQESENCQLELKYAKTRNKRILPCIVTDQEGWKPSGWLGLITAGLLYVNFKDDSEENIRLKAQELIDQIKEQPSASKPPSEPTYLIELVKYEYTRNARIERIMNPAQSFPIERSYINLAIVKAKEQHEKEKQLRDAEHSNTIMSSFEEIYGTKTAIAAKDIFETCKTQEKQVLVFGRAGIGKSTFCRYVAYQWAIGSYWSKYELLALIPLRRLTADRYPQLSPGQNYSLIDLVKKEILQYNLSEKDDKLLKKQFDAKRTLWILDGYDEVIQNVPSHLKYLLEQLLKTPHHILTSRPYLNTLSYDVKMEITGFTDENIEKYVQQFFDQMKDEQIKNALDDAPIKSRKLFSYLKSNPTIWGVAHIPLLLEIICSLSSNNDLSETEQLTITTLYTKITVWLCRRYLRTPDNQIPQVSKEEIDQLCHKELVFLESIAFNAMKSNTIILRPALLNKALNETKVSSPDYTNILKIGILKSFDKQGIVGTQIEMEKDHYFVHLSFQEYFAARYLINTLNGSTSEEAIEFIKYHKYNQRYSLVFTFASGLLSESEATPCLDLFWDALLDEPLDLVGIRHMQIIISCMEEISDKSILPRRTQLLEWIAECIKYNIISQGKIILQSLSQSFQRAPSLASEQIVINVLINQLQYSEMDSATATFSFLSALSISNPSVALITSVTIGLDNKNDKARRYACEALGKLGEKAATSKVISKLVSALEDENVYVRKYACEALEKLGEKAATSAVISQLVSLLGDEDEYIRMTACEALEKLGEKAATSEVISKLVSAVGDGNCYRRKIACKVLGKLGEKAATNEVISKLVSALLDENKDVRRNACVALKDLGKKAATSEVISKLVSALGDEDKDVRRNAYEALEKLGDKAATSEVISKLVSAVEDENVVVRMNACKALGKLGEKAATNEMISKLVSAVEDENEDVRKYACEALGEMGEKSATSEVISKLVSAVGDETINVRRYACEALGEMGEKAATSEVISKLVSALGDEKEDVRMNACYVLGKVGKKAATNEVISKLVSAVEDENVVVRMNACKALGKLGEKAATSKVISKLVSAVEDENAVVRTIACKVLGKLGEKAATNELISKLVSALEDENKDVRRSACVALKDLGKKAATSEVISKLMSALGDENVYVSCEAYEALGKMGEKVATNEMISKLVVLINSDYWGSYQAANAIGSILSSSSVIVQLDPKIIVDICLCKRASDCLKSVSGDHLMETFFITKNPDWLCAVRQLTLLKGDAVTTMEGKVVMYGSKEPVEIPIPSSELRQQLIKAFTDQAKRVHLYCGMLSKSENKFVALSVCCNIS